MLAFRLCVKAAAKRAPLAGLAVFILFIGGCGMFFSVDKPAVDCKKDLACYIEAAAGRINSIGSDINYWSNWLTIALLATILFGTVATLVIAMQSKENERWTRPIGLIATTFGAAITTLLTTFHVQDNIDKLIEIRSKVGKLTNNLERDVRGKGEDDVDLLLWQYSTAVNEQMDERAKLKGSAGRLNMGPALAPQASTPPPAARQPPAAQPAAK